MAKSKSKNFEASENEKMIVETKLPESDENKVRFLVWFTGALGRFKGLKPHHMNAIRVYFTELGLREPESPQAYDEGLKKFGFK